MEQLRNLRDLSELAQLAGDLPQISQIMERVMIGVAVIVLILSLLQCFFGYRMLRFWVTIIGFLVGFIGGGAFAAYASDDPSAILVVLAGLSAGVILGFLSFKLYLVGVFLYCGLLAAAVAYMIRFPEGRWQNVKLVLMIVVFIAAGVLAVVIQRYFVIGVTAVSGGVSAARALSMIVPELSEDPKMTAAAAVVLVILGAAVQVMTTRNLESSRKKKKKD
ncbi:MAG: DUF4203 domain-containing protein [Eubacterium sp.]|nr:DUF4203 domain-containing protein [Eubacterium sp.]